ncbi:glycosyl hydrolase family 32 [Bacteroidota bacterium]
MLSLNDKWIWDFWFAQIRNEYHIFYLQAPKNLINEQKRHHNATIGHAVSENLVDWKILPDALTPGTKGSWDDLATWTGSIIRHNNLWYMFYTGVNHAEKGLIQRVGFATSNDLISWEKYNHNPVIEADEKYYEILDLYAWHDQAWRDPFVFRYNNSFHAFITARVNCGPVNGRGVIAHAESDDLINWNVLPPVTEPGEFGQLEVPQLVEINKKFILIFSTAAEHHSRQRLMRTNIIPVTGTHYLCANNPLGPFKYSTDQFLVGDKVGSLYSGKMIQTPDEEWRMISFRNYQKDGQFIGTITDPFGVDLEII